MNPNQFAHMPIGVIERVNKYEKAEKTAKLFRDIFPPHKFDVIFKRGSMRAIPLDDNPLEEMKYRKPGRPRTNWQTETICYTIYEQADFMPYPRSGLIWNMAIELTADEVALLNVIKDIKASGYGEVIAVIQDGKIKIVKQTTTVKL